MSKKILQRKNSKNSTLKSLCAKKFMFGFDLFKKGQLHESSYIMQDLLKMEPHHFDALHLSGIILGHLNNPKKAIEYFYKALKINNHNAELHSNLANALSDDKKLHLAVIHCNLSIKLNPSNHTSYSNRANIFQKLGKLDEALDSYISALKFSPNNHSYFSSIALILVNLKRYEEALVIFDQIITLRPDLAEVYNNRGVALQELRLLDEALVSYRQAITLDKYHINALDNQGNLLKELSCFEEAIASYQKAIAINPDYTEAHWNLSLVQLLLGNFNEGWLEYEWRSKSEVLNNNVGIRSFDQPLWLGKEPLKDKTILLYAEQGFGDTIQFCRYVPLVSALGAKVILEVQLPLVNLLKGLGGFHQIIGRGDKLPEFDYQCPLLSLPLAFKTTIDSIPNQVPYIHSSIDNQNKWQEHIGDGGFKIAICWQGSTQNKIDVGRSFPVSLFEGISKISGVRLISLQKNEGVEQMKSLPTGMRIETLPEDFDNGEHAFLDSAAIMKCVDLVITSDTALTHLAGALGVKTWLPLKHVPDWRWGLDRSNSLWYSNTRLFRQAVRDDWINVFDKMEAELKILVSIKTTTQT